MAVEPGILVVGVAMLLFYLRLAQLRGRRRRQPDRDPRPAMLPSYQVRSWVLAGVGGLLMLVGLALRTSDAFPPEFRPYWWIAVTAGVLLFTFGFG